MCGGFLVVFIWDENPLLMYIGVISGGFLFYRKDNTMKNRDIFDELFQQLTTENRQKVLLLP